MKFVQTLVAAAATVFVAATNVSAAVTFDGTQNFDVNLNLFSAGPGVFQLDLPGDPLDDHLIARLTSLDRFKNGENTTDDFTVSSSTFVTDPNDPLSTISTMDLFTRMLFPAGGSSVVGFAANDALIGGGSPTAVAAGFSLLDELTFTSSGRVPFLVVFKPGFNGATARDFGNLGGTNQINPRILGEISAVPEPGTWLLMLAGFGLVGVALKRRPHAAAAAA